jgi:hypothetical protein
MAGGENTLAMTPTTTCLFSVLCIARCGPTLGVGEKKEKTQKFVEKAVPNFTYNIEGWRISS